MFNPALSLCDKNNINLIPVFTELWTAYVDELSVFSKRLQDEPVTEGEILSMWYNPDLEIYFVSLDQEYIGFLLLGINGNKHECSDWFIGEFYIAKKWQSKGIGKSVVNQLLSRKKGSYCMFILRNNVRALEFWKRTFDKNGYENTSERFFCGSTPDDCYFRMYEPKDSLL